MEYLIVGHNRRVNNLEPSKKPVGSLGPRLKALHRAPFHTDSVHAYGTLYHAPTASWL